MATPTVKSASSFAFGPFVLTPKRRLLLEDGARVSIGRRAFDILVALVQRQGEVVSKRELIASAWSDIVVDEANLKVTIATLRQILSRNSNGARYIATVTGRGYKLVASVEASDLDQSPAISNGLANRSHNLPACTKRTFGNTDAIVSVLKELTNYQLVSIVGPGGIGKTTVALAVAHKAAEFFDDGVWLVDLSELEDQSRVAEAITVAVGSGGHAAKMPASVSDYVRDRKMLLVLDNCEHVLDEVATWVDRILNSAKYVKMLTTSREPLCIKGERVRRLLGLSLPEKSDGITAEEALSFPAVQVFVDRASSRSPSFKLDDTNAPVVTEICRKLDGLALAIERSAMRVDALGVVEILDRLENRFHMLDDYRSGSERHRTLTATIDFSYSLLPKSEQAIMRRLATFAGAFSLESACAIGGGDGTDRAKVVNGIANLVTKSLLTAETLEGEMEYRQNNITRAFALERLIEHGELEATRRRHAEYFLGLAEMAAAEADRSSQDKWAARYGTKIDDVRDALNWAFSHPDCAFLAVRLAIAAIPFWRLHSKMEECRSSVEQVLNERFSVYRTSRDELTLNMALGKALLHMREPVLQVQAIFNKALKIAEALSDVGVQSECTRFLAG